MEFLDDPDPSPNTPILSPLIECTTTVGGRLTEVDNISEKDTVPFMRSSMSAEIPKIDSPWHALRFQDYKTPEKEKTTNRGRKKKIKVRKPRKSKGTNPNFESSIQFTVIDTCIVPKSRGIQAKPHYLEFKDNNDGTITIKKEYKPRLFRSGGKFNMAGVLLQDLSDAVGPLTKVCNLLSHVLLLDSDGLNTPCKIERITAVMRNYKAQLLSGTLNLDKFVDFVAAQHPHYIRFSQEHVFELLATPILNGRNSVCSIGQSEFGWYQWVRSSNYTKPTLNIQQSVHYLRNRLGFKDMYVATSKLETLLNNPIIAEVYAKVAMLAIKIEKNEMIHNEVYASVISELLREPITELMKKLRKDAKQVAHLVFDPKDDNNVRITVSAPYADHPDAKVNVRIYKSGKLNLHGCKTAEQAHYIHGGFSKYFKLHPEFIIGEGEQPDSPYELYSDSEPEQLSDSDNDE
jgi:hypothetical protein